MAQDYNFRQIFNTVLDTTPIAIDLSLQAPRITGEVLKAALSEFLSSSNSLHKGHMTMKQLQNKVGSGKLDNIEITENNIKDFLDVARKYDVDFALKRDSSTQPPTYHVFFQTAKQENFQRAFTEYVKRKDKQLSSKAPMNQKRLKKEIEKASQKPIQSKAHHKVHKKESIR